MAATKTASSDTKSSSKMHRRSRSGTSFLGCMNRCALADTDVFQVALHVDYEGKSARKASLLVKHATTWVCDATTSDQCGGAMESNGGSRRRSLRT